MVEPDRVDPGPGLTITAGPGIGLASAVALARSAMKRALMPTLRVFALRLFMLESTKSSESKPFGWIKVAQKDYDGLGL
jgi:hypothetical protein